MDDWFCYIIYAVYKTSIYQFYTIAADLSAFTDVPQLFCPEKLVHYDYFMFWFMLHYDEIFVSRKKQLLFSQKYGINKVSDKTLRKGRYIRNETCFTHNGMVACYADAAWYHGICLGSADR